MSWLCGYRKYVAGLMLGLSATYTIEMNKHVVRKEYTIHQDKINSSVKVLFISDIHYGCCHDKRRTSKTLDKLSGDNFDIVLIGGDTITYPETTKTEMCDVITKISKVKSKYGKYFIYGNHDYSEDGAVFTRRKHSDYYTKEDLVDSLMENGILILDDDMIVLDNGITIVGRSDYSNTKDSRKDISYFNIDNSTFNICVDHYPVDMINCSTSGIDLQLSGHTHGGQVFPMNLLIPYIWKYPVYGLHEYGKMKLIVSSGMGVGAHALRTVHRREFVIINILG